MFFYLLHTYTHKIFLKQKGFFQSIIITSPPVFPMSKGERVRESEAGREENAKE